MEPLTTNQKFEKLDEIFNKLAKLSNQVLILETERDAIMNSFSDLEQNLWEVKVTEECFGLTSTIDEYDEKD